MLHSHAGLVPAWGKLNFSESRSCITTSIAASTWGPGGGPSPFRFRTGSPQRDTFPRAAGVQCVSVLR